MNTCSRRSSGSRIPRALAGCLAAVACAAGPALAAEGTQAPAAPAAPAAPVWYESYRRAVADAELENWDGVVANIQQAIKANAKSQRNVRTYGMWHASYIPYYYLGLAQYHLGRGEEALKNLETEETAGVVQHDPVAYLKLRRVASVIKTGGKPGAAGGPPGKPPGPGSPVPGDPASRAAAAPPADNLVGGLQSFFQGDYDRSIAFFQEEMKKSKREDLTLHLYLGMAYAGKASESGLQGALWRNLAVLEFQRVHALDPTYTLASGIFSEEMVQLFGEAQKR